MPYDVTILTVRPTTNAKALAALDAWLKSARLKGELLACLQAELGALNQIVLIRDYADAAEISQDRDRILKEENLFGCSEFIAGMAMDTYVPFDFLEPIRPGKFGPYYELRTYMLKPGRLAPTIELWRKMVGGRIKLSPLITAMYTVTGPAPRFLHIWPYRSLDERIRIRAEAISTGVWPPPGGPDNLAVQHAEIFIPTAFSPMQ